MHIYIYFYHIIFLAAIIPLLTIVSLQKILK